MTEHAKMSSAVFSSPSARSAMLKEARDAFDLFDVDKNGTIDASELENVRRISSRLARLR